MILYLKINHFFPLMVALRAFIGGILMFNSFSVYSQAAPFFEAVVDAPNASVGYPFEISFRLKNAEGRNFRPPVWDNAIRVASGPAGEQSMGFINGRSYTEQGWRYSIVAKKAGAVTVGPASVTVDGKILHSQPLTLTIGQSSSSSVGPSAGGEVFIISELSSKIAFEGQQVSWRILLYTLVGVDGIDLMEMPNFKGFYAQDKKRFDTRLQNQTIKGKKYAVKTLYESAVFPQESGELTIGSAKIRVSIEQKGTFGGFFGGVPKILETEPVKLMVKPLPLPIPEKFSGGVGRYTWEVKSDKEALTTDDALTLQVLLRGNGDVRRFSAPKITLPAGLEAFDPKVISEETYENGEEFVHEQVLEYAILPKIPGEYAFQPQFSWFNPDSNRYLYYSTEQPIKLSVTAGINYNLSGTTADADQSFSTNRPTGGVVDQLKFWLSKWPLGYWVGLLSGGVFILALIGWIRGNKNQPPAVAVVERQVQKQSQYTIQELLAKAAQHDADKANNPSTGYALILKAIQQFLSEHLEILPVMINRETVSALLIARQIPPVTIQTLILLWDQCESAVYGGHITTAAALDNTLKDVKQIMKDLSAGL